MGKRSCKEDRPDLSAVLTGAELRRWYWRKNELVERARDLKLKTSSGKFVILERIAHYLDTGETSLPGDRNFVPVSTFNWHSEQLSRTTTITDSYRNSQNVRQFFQRELGAGFRFNIAFMDWMKANVGKTLSDACTAYLDIRKAESDREFRTEIKSHNQFNQFIRDFLDDNPQLGIADARRVWAIKTRMPSETGRHRYVRSDIELK
ncbi:DUF6434 domain-containing protein [Altererythrobacter sp. ZODW24]|uniref:DUF6434 domain-containing protein n=1 Tax=Altererythrobacter sp. ZODW24 TaxID=2185142 RepID=UPI000DF7BAFD|nr:DUF6434 domain-containing protein [Altererythrobacter sp. ZODW24]